MMRVTIKPEILWWASERAGFDPGALAQRIPRFAAWMSGEAQPTLRQLEDFAKVARIPIGYLFLSEPLAETVPIPDFRTVANERIHHPSPDLLDTIYLCQQRQEWYRDFARTMGEAALPFVDSAKVTADVTQTAAEMRNKLGFSIEERRRAPTWTDALRLFIEQADTLGVLVMVSGVVGGNNKRRLNPQEFRGFALSDGMAPLVFVNGADTKAAQMFTLAHELAHIWLGQSALSDAQAVAAPEEKVESWCNRVAAELLVPLAAVRAEYDRAAALPAEMGRLARRFKASTLVILRRIHDAGLIPDAHYWAMYRAELDRLQAIPKGKGGDFYLTLGARASKRFTRAMVVSTLEGHSSFTEAFRLLGLKKMTTFQELKHSLGVML